MKVLLTSQIDEEALAFLRRHAPVEILDNSSRERLLERVGEADILFVKAFNVVVDRDVIDRGKNLKLIARHGSGYENVDIDYASQKGIPVSYTGGSNARSVAEYTFGLMLVLTRRFFEASAAAKKGNPDWTKLKGTDLLEKTMGIIGLGRIGREVAKLAVAFGMKVLVSHPGLSAENTRDRNFQLVDLETLLRQSDFVSIHASLNPRTRGLIGYRELAMMKPTAVLLNTARGELIDEQALVKALRNKIIAAAGLDVVTEEPVKKENPLLHLENALVMPHLASKTYEAQKRTAMWAIEDIIRVVRGEPPERVVNPEILDKRRGGR